MQWATLVTAAAALALFTAVPAQAQVARPTPEVCPADLGPVNCHPCRGGIAGGELSLTNSLYQLARADTSGKKVAPNLANFKLFGACQDDDGEWCELLNHDDPDAVAQAEGYTIGTYVVGVVGWASIGLALGLLIGTIGVCCVCGRFCLPLCGINTCGKRYPTPKTGFWSSFGLGFIPNDNKSLAKGFGYGKGKWIARICNLLTLVLVVATIMVGMNKGVKQVQPALKAIPAKTQGAMTVMQGLVKPIGVHLKNTATLTLNDAGVALMDIAHRYSDYEKMANNTENLSYNFLIGYPHADRIIVTALAKNVSLQELKKLSITGLVEVQNLNRTSVFIVFPALDDLRRETRRLDVLRNVSAQATDHMVPRVEAGDTAIGRLLDPVSGAANVVLRLNSTITTLPNAAFVGDTAFAPSGPSLLVLDSGGMFGNINFVVRNDLYFRMEDILFHLITTIDLDETGRVLEIHNANIQRNKDTHVFTTVADELETSLEAANNLTLDLNLQLNARLNDSVNSFSATNASRVVGQVQYYLHDFTLDKFYFLHPDILDIWTSGGIPTFLDLAYREAVTVNRTLMRTPRCFNRFPELRARFQATWKPALVYAQVFDDEMHRFSITATRELQNTSTYINAYDTAEFNARSVNVTYNKIQLSNTTAMRALISINHTVSSARNMQIVNDHNASRTTDRVVFMLHLMRENSYEYIFPSVSLAMTNLLTLSQSRCDRVGAIGALCTTDDDCFGGDCISGLPRCRFAFLRVCAYDTDCSVFDEFDYCLNQQDSFSVARRALTWYWKIGRPGIAVDAAIPQMLIVNATASAYPRLDDTPVRDFLVLKETAARIDTNRTVYLMNKLQNDTSPETMLIERTFTTAANIVDQSQYLHPLAPVPTAVAYNDTISAFNAYGSEIVLCSRWSEATRQYFVDDLPYQLSLLRPEVSDDVIKNVGLHRQMEYIATMIDALVNYTAGSCDTDARWSTIDRTVGLRERLETLSAQEFADAGPVHYLANVFLTKSRFVPSNIGNLGGAFVNKRWKSGRIQDWGPDPSNSPNSSDRVCVTSTCLDASIDEWLNGTNGAGLHFELALIASAQKAMFSHLTPGTSTGTDLMSMIVKDFFDSFSIQSRPASSIGFLSTPRNTTHQRLYMIPLLGILLSSCAAIMCCRTIKRIQRWFALLSFLLLVPVVAATFWIAGGTFFPLALVLSDMCGSMENVAFKFAAGSVDAVCERSLGGVWVGNGTCDLTVPLSPETVEVNLTGIIESVLHSCESNPNAIEEIFLRISNAYEDLPFIHVNRTLAQFGELCYPHDEVQDVVILAARTLATNIRSMFDDISDVYRCETVRPAVLAIRDSMCCEFGNAVIYQTLSWFLLAFFLCACGIPSAFFGMKRFPGQLWGRELEMSTTFQPEILFNERKAFFRRREKKKQEIERLAKRQEELEAERTYDSIFGTGASAPRSGGSPDDKATLLGNGEDDDDDDLDGDDGVLDGDDEVGLLQDDSGPGVGGRAGVPAGVGVGIQ